MEKTRPSRESDKIMLRVPDGMRDRIAEVAKANNRSMNSEIVARLQDDFDPAENLPAAVREEIGAVAAQRGVSFDEALTLVVLAGLNKGEKAVLYIKSAPGMSLIDYKTLFDAAESCIPPDANIVMEQG